MGARRAVAQQELHLVGPRDAQSIELVDVGGELHEGGHARTPGELGVLHDPGTTPLGIDLGGAHEEVGETDELGGRERRLVDHFDGGIGERGVGAAHRIGERLDVGGARRGDLAHRVAPARAVLVEDPELVRRAEARRALERGVFGVVDRGHAPELGVDRPQPGELAFGRGLQVAGAPDDSRVVLDVPHAPTLIATPDIDRRRLHRCATTRSGPAVSEGPDRLRG